MPAYYANSVAGFLSDNKDGVLAQLASRYAEDRYRFLETLQVEAWRNQIDVLQTALADVINKIPSAVNWSILLEYLIPRRMGRIDAVLLVNNTVIVLEFKKGTVDQSAIIQVEDYALDLLHFHKPSRHMQVVPAVVGSSITSKPLRKYDNELQPPLAITTAELGDSLFEVARTADTNKWVDHNEWNYGEYCPVPTVLEAAVAMFAGMAVDDIAKSETDPINLTTTIDSLKSIVLEAKKSGRKVICFVTGVPGAGKTLAGLKLVHDSALRSSTGANIAFLSGNGPLVKILRSALALDQKKRRGIDSREAARDPKTLIQGVYAFKNSTWTSTEPPNERILVFDEAQRAWDQKTNVKKLRGNKECHFSEPALILDVLNRHSGWAALIALIGNGQEIHVGEAGLKEWGDSLDRHFRDWKIYASPQALQGTPAVAASKLFDETPQRDRDLVVDPCLHLDNPTRQFRGKTVASWVDAVLQGDSTAAASALLNSPEYSIRVTRNLDAVRSWLSARSRGSERYGLVASSGSGRLRAYGIETSSGFHKNIPIDHWFLKDALDVRSSYRLEVAATEFEIQGLELDWVGMCWGGDFLVSAKRTQSSTWDVRQFLGSRWTAVRNERAQDYVCNTYRVLLTRARQGMVIFVPPGSSGDSTIEPAGFNRTVAFLIEAGAKEIA